jgi:hypothetical protein
VRFVGTLARRVIHALFGGRGGTRHSAAVQGADTWRGTGVHAGSAGIGPSGTGSDPVLEEACRRAVQAAVIEPGDATGDDGLLARLVGGRHDARQEVLSERTAERIAALEGTIAAEEDDRAAARAAAERARDEWHEDRAAVAAAAERVDAARDDLRGWRRERNALPLRARGYVGHTLKWVLVLAVALALAPLVYLSMQYLDDPVVQILVTLAASAGIFAAEHAIGFGMAHIAQHVGRRARIGWLFVAAAVVTAAMVGAEFYAGQTRDQATAILTGGTGFDAGAAAAGTATTGADTVSMLWTVPLGIGATIAGSLIVALYVLGGPGRELKKRIKDGKALLAEAEQEHRAVEPRAERGRARYEQAEAAAGAIAGRTARARAEIRGAEVAETHLRLAEEGERTSNLAAAEIAYHGERARRAEWERERAAADARRAEQVAQDEAAQAHREDRDDARLREREQRSDAEQQRRDERGDARRTRRDARADARRTRRDERRGARRTARRQRRAERFARVGRVAHAVGDHASDGVRLGGPAATAGLLAAGLGAPGLIALAAGSCGLTAAHLLTRSRRRPTAATAAGAATAAASAPVEPTATSRAVAPTPAPVARTAGSPAAVPARVAATAPSPAATSAAPFAGVLRPSQIAHVNGTSTNGSQKEHA